MWISRIFGAKLWIKKNKNWWNFRVTKWEFNLTKWYLCEVLQQNIPNIHVHSRSI